VAANCFVKPAVTEGFAGVTAIDINMGTVTASVAEPLMRPALAVIVLVPTLAEAATP
jgi:hypothetical protein